MSKRNRAATLSDEVRELFLEAQAPVFEDVRRQWVDWWQRGAERRAEWDLFNPAKRRKIRRESRARNREAAIAYSRAYYAKNKEYWKKRWLDRKAQAPTPAVCPGNISDQGKTSHA